MEYAAQSPFPKGLGQEDSNHGLDEGSNSGVGAAMSASVWSPSLGGHSNLAPNEFKINFGGHLSASSSPLGPGGVGGVGQAGACSHRSLHSKKLGQEDFNGASGADIASGSEDDVMYTNRQALAERIKDMGGSSSANGGLGIADVPPSPTWDAGMSIPVFEGYLGSSLALDIGSPAAPDQSLASAPTVQATGRGARERKATPKSRGLVYGRSAAGGGDGTKSARMGHGAHNAATPTAEFLDLGLGSDRGPLTCNCKKSRCLKLYCECFHALKFCQNCKCFDCENRVGNEAVRNAVINTIKERDPHAFESKVRMDADSNMKGHLSGCHCKRTSCLKKYCECFTLAVPCTQRCRCLKCQNNASLYEVKLGEAKYTAAMLVSAAASAIDASGGDEYLSHASQQSALALRQETSSEEGGYDSRGARSTASSAHSQSGSRSGVRDGGSPVSDSGRRSYGQSVSGYGSAGPVPSSPAGMSLLDLAGACTEQEKHIEAQEGLLALSPQRKVASRVQDVAPLATKLNLKLEKDSS